MMYLKIMGSENMPDHDSSKPHTLVSVSEYQASNGVHGGLFISYLKDGASCIDRVFSNIYVMNAEGKTINTISPPGDGMPN